MFDIPEPPSLPEDTEQIEISSHSRKKKGRRPLPGHLPRIEVIHDLPEEEKKCACGLPGPLLFISGRAGVKKLKGCAISASTML